MRFFGILIVLLGVIPTTLAQSPTDASVDYIISAQNPNGGWSDGFSTGSGYGVTVDALLALTAVGYDLDDLPSHPVEYLRDFVTLSALTITPSQAAKLALAAHVLDEDLRNFNGLDLIEAMQQATELTTYETCLVTLVSGIIEIPADTPNIIDAANEDGGWGFGTDDPSDAATTALCLQALAIDEVDESAIEAGLAYLRNVQNADGSWGSRPDDYLAPSADSQSTALVIMALNALDQDLAAWNNPDQALLQFRQTDGGFRLAEGIDLPAMDVTATSYALIALSGNSWSSIR